jgi:DNA polymerase-3 subunit delta'
MLVTLAEGSPGRGMALVEQGGIELYQTLLSLLSGLPDPDVEALHTFGDRLAKKDAVDAFRTVTELLLWWLARIIRTQAQQTGGGSSDAVELMPGGVDLGSRLVASRSLDQWVEVWENVRRLFASTEAINLERKQVFLSAFTMLARAARA